MEWAAFQGAVFWLGRWSTPRSRSVKAREPGPRLDQALLAALTFSWPAAVLAHEPAPALAQEGDEAERIEEVVVRARAELLGLGEAYANNAVAGDALQSESPMLDALSRLNRLPGANVTQGDAVGGNDWSTRVYVRGMSNATDTAQVGFMVDGFPNGGSTYGDGQKPGAFVDNENVAALRLGQNTADIGSASNSALGGTIRYATADPLPRRRVRVDYTGGEHRLSRAFLRTDTGALPGGLLAYASVSDSTLRSWIGVGSGRFERRHVDLKIARTSASGVAAKLKAAWNYRNETDYNSVTLAEFRADPASDRLLDEFDIDTVALWRPGWGGTSWHKSAALEIRREDLRFSTRFVVTPYMHRHRGWGWWVPPYRIATRDGRVEGPEGAREFFADTFRRAAEGALVPAPSTSVANHACLRGRYAGDRVDYALAQRFDCANAERIASRRRSGYWNRRVGVTGQVERDLGERYALAAGLWLERQDRDNNRQWFDLDPNDPGTIKPDPAALHWTHFERNFESDSRRFFVEGRAAFGTLEVSAGLVRHAVETRYAARLEGLRRQQDRAEWLPKLGAVYALRPGVELFASYSRNVAMLADDLLAAGTTERLRPERSDNFDLGMRWNGARGGLALQAFAQRFDGRLGAVNLAAVGGDLYLQGAIEILNVGGVDSGGVELAASVELGHGLAAYAAYSYLAAEYSDDVPGEGIVAGNRLVNAPRHRWFGELTWRRGPAWRVAANVARVGQRAADLANSANAPAYALLGLSARYRHAPRAGRPFESASMQFNASNLTDERYLSAPDGDQGGTFFLGAGRMLSLTGRFEF